MSAVTNEVPSEATVTRIEHEVCSPMAWRSDVSDRIRLESSRACGLHHRTRCSRCQTAA